MSVVCIPVSSGMANAMARPKLVPWLLVRACATTIQTGWVVVIVYASVKLMVPRFSMVLMVGAARHVRIVVHVRVLAMVWIGMKVTMVCAYVVSWPGCRGIHPTYALRRVVLLVSVPRVRLESYRSFLPGGWSSAWVCQSVLCLWCVEYPWLVSCAVCKVCVSKGGSMVLWMVVVTTGVLKLFLYWARLVLAPRTGHTGVACRNVCDVVAIVVVPVPVIVA